MHRTKILQSLCEMLFLKTRKRIRKGTTGTNRYRLKADEAEL